MRSKARLSQAQTMPGTHPQDLLVSSIMSSLALSLCPLCEGPPSPWRVSLLSQKKWKSCFLWGQSWGVKPDMAS
jgi:hypothetical protein